MLRRGDVFDTAKIKALYFHKLGKQTGKELLTEAEKQTPVKVKQRAQPGIADMGNDPDSLEIQKEWLRTSLIWVCVPDDGFTMPSFFSHIGKNQKFHHSSFKAGHDVICAGEWIVEKGKLRKVSANSGHYRPELDHLPQAVMHLARAWRAETVVPRWNIRKTKWEEAPVLQFKEGPRGDGSYKVHPLSE